MNRIENEALTYIERNVSVVNIASLLLPIVISTVSAYGVLQATRAEVAGNAARITAMRDWIEKVDERSQLRREESLAELHREIDVLQADVRELRGKDR